MTLFKLLCYANKIFSLKIPRQIHIVFRNIEGKTACKLWQEIQTKYCKELKSASRRVTVEL